MVKCMWAVATTDKFDEWFEGLDEVAPIEIMAKVELLKQLGPALPRPHADTLKGSQFKNLKELRAETSAQVLRVAFAFDPERKATLLVGVNKAGVNQRQFYAQLITRAEKLFAQHLAKLKSRKKGE